MKKSCFGYADTADNTLVVMDIMAKHGIQIVGVTDGGHSIYGFVRFRVFGLADEQHQLDLVAKDIGKATNVGVVS